MPKGILKLHGSAYDLLQVLSESPEALPRGILLTMAGYSPRSNSLLGKTFGVLRAYGLVHSPHAGAYMITERGKIAFAIALGKRIVRQRRAAERQAKMERRSVRTVFIQSRC